MLLNAIFFLQRHAFLWTRCLVRLGVLLQRSRMALFLLLLRMPPAPLCHLLALLQPCASCSSHETSLSIRPRPPRRSRPSQPARRRKGDVLYAFFEISSATAHSGAHPRRISPSLRRRGAARRTLTSPRCTSPPPCGLLFFHLLPLHQEECHHTFRAEKPSDEFVNQFAFLRHPLPRLHIALSFFSSQSLHRR